MSRRPARHTIGRTLGIALLILGIGHVPLPRAEYHSVGHSDGPNQVCELHRHLLRWHPQAGPGDMVAVLHWHWFVPQPSHSHDRSHGDDQDGQPPLVLLADEAVADDAPPGPTLDALPRSLDRPAVAPDDVASVALASSAMADDPSGRLWRAAIDGQAPAARLAPRIALLQRWTC